MHAQVATPKVFFLLELQKQQTTLQCNMDKTFNFTMTQEDQLALASEWEEQMMMEADEFLDDEHRE